VPCTSPQTCSVRGGSDSLPPVILPEEDLDATPRGLDRICVVPCVGIDEVDAVVDSGCVKP
jgi:hypothetical protein